MEKHFAVIGAPIAHSLSPLMHNSGFSFKGIDAVYQRFHVEPYDLENAVKGLKALNFKGWNVTLPHKEAILKYLDELTPEAQRAQAVNTVKVEGTRLIGHSTDGEGFIQSLKNIIELRPSQRAVIIGAGGAAKSIAASLVDRGVSLHILNRTPEKAKELSQLVSTWGGKASWEGLETGPWINQCDLIVQTTSVGLKNEKVPVSLEGIKFGTVVVDIIFNPWETPFLKEAKSFGCKTINGLGMLIFQGALAWNFWLNLDAPVEIMEIVLERYFKGL